MANPRAYPVGSPIRAQLEAEERAANLRQAEAEVSRARELRQGIAQQAEAQRRQREAERNVKQPGFRGRMADFFVSGIGKTVQSLPGLLYDLARAPFDEDVSAVGALKARGGQALGGLFGPRGAIGSLVGLVPPGGREFGNLALGAYGDVRREAIIEPLARGLAGTNPFGGLEELAAFDDPDLPNTLGRAVIARTGLDSEEGVGRVVSGGIDMLSAIFLDPGVVGGKAAASARAARGATRGTAEIRSAAGLAKAVDSNAATDFLEKVGRMSTPEVADAYFANHNNGLAMAAALKEAPDVAGRKLVLRSMLGDEEAKAELAARHGEAALVLDNLQTNLDGVHAAFPKTYPFSIYREALEEVTPGLEQATRAAAQAEERARRAVAVWDELDRVPSETLAGKVRTGEGRIAQTVGARSDWYQSSPWARPVHVVFDRLPKANVDLNRPQSAIEFRRMLNQARMPIERQDGWLERYARADTAADRFTIFNQAEEASIRWMAERAGIPDGELDDMVRMVDKGRSRLARSVSGRSYAGHGRDIVTLDDGLGPIEQVHYPVFVSQAPNYFFLGDYDRVRRVVTKWGKFKARHPGVAVPVNIANEFQDIWRPAQIMKVGTSLVIQADQQARIYAKLGAMTHVKTISRRAFAWTKDRMDGMPAPQRGLRMRQFKGIDYPDPFGSTPDDARLVKALNTGRSSMDELRRAEVTMQSTSPLGAKAKPIEVGAWVRAADRANFGQVQSIDEASGTAKVFFFNRKEGTRATVTLPVGQLTNVTLESGGKRGMQLGLAQQSWREIAPTEPEHLDAMARALNLQLGQDPMARRLLEGQSREEVIGWLRSPEGRQYASQLPLRTNYDAWVDTAADVVQSIAAGNDEIRGLALAGKATRADLERILPDPALRPNVNGMVIDQIGAGSQLAQFGQRTVDGFFRWMFSLPDDVLSRNPLYDSLYSGGMERRIALSLDQGIRPTDAMVARWSKVAREAALKEAKTTLYDLADQSRAAEILRFAVPFFEPVREGITIWSELAVQHPQRVARIYALLRAPIRAGFVHDDRGNRIDERGRHIDPLTEEEVPKGARGRREMIDLPLPSWAREVPWIGEALGSKGTISFDRHSVVTRFGWPRDMGFGPILQIPINDIVRSKPSLEEAARFILPFGTTDVPKWQQVLPAGARRLVQASEADENRAYAGSQNSILLSKMTDFRLEHGRVPTRDEVATMREAAIDENKAFWSLRTVVNWLSPYAITFESPYKPYADAYRAAQAVYVKDNMALATPDGEERTPDQFFAEIYGEEFFALTQSVTHSMNGVPATIASAAEAERYKKLIEKYPQLGGLIAGTDVGEFNRSVYLNQLNTPMEPGSSTMQREVYDLVEASRQPQVRQGWNEYTGAMDIIDAIRKERGLSSLASKAAEDLAAAKRAIIEYLSGKYPEWAEEYGKTDMNTWKRKVEGLEAIAADPRLREREEIKVLADYLDARKGIAAILAKRKDKTLSAQSNADVLEAWDGIVNVLADRNLAFADIVHRYLERDPVVVR